MDRHPILLPYNGNSIISHIFAEDLAAALFLVTNSDIDKREVFNLSMEERLPLSEFIKNITGVLNVNTEIFKLNLKEEKNINNLLSEASPYSGKWVSVMSNRLFKSKFCWEPTLLSNWLRDITEFQLQNFSMDKLKNYGNRELENSLLKSKKDLFQQIG